MEPDELHLLIDSLAEGVYVLSPDRRIIAFNRAAEIYFGLERESVIGRPFKDAVPGRAPAIEEAVERAFHGHPEQTFDFASILVAGRVARVTVRATPAGNVFVVFSDLTAERATRRKLENARRSSDARLALATQAAKIGIWDWLVEPRKMIFCPRARAIWGFGPDEEITIEKLRERMHPDYREAVSAHVIRALDPHTRDSAPLQYRIIHPDGGIRWLRVHGEALFTDDGQGAAPVRYVGTIEDITDSKRIEEQLRESEARVRLAVGAGRMAVWAVDVDRRLFATEELNQLLGLPAGTVPTVEDVQGLYYPGERERLEAIAARTRESNERFFEAEFRMVRPNDGALRWMVIRAETRREEGQHAGWLGVVFDITERKEAEEHLQLLAREVDHRSNNLLAIVQSAIALTKASTVEDFKQALVGRVAALARAHQLLATSRWTGADLRRLVEEELRPFQSEDGNRIRPVGEPLPVSATTAQALAMVVHELTTNAVKYGALSSPDGWVTVSWTKREEFLNLSWVERGGPVISPPTRRGVGTQVIERTIGSALQGRASMQWDPEGLVCDIEVPVP